MSNFDSEFNAVKDLVNELTEYFWTIEWDEANVREILNERNGRLYPIFTSPYTN